MTNKKESIQNRRKKNQIENLILLIDDKNKSSRTYTVFSNTISKLKP